MLSHTAERKVAFGSYIKSSVSLKYWFWNPANNNNLLGTNDINRAISDVDLMTQMISASDCGKCKYHTFFLFAETKDFEFLN